MGDTHLPVPAPRCAFRTEWLARPLLSGTGETIYDCDEAGYNEANVRKKRVRSHPAKAAAGAGATQARQTAARNRPRTAFSSPTPAALQPISMADSPR